MFQRAELASLKQTTALRGDAKLSTWIYRIVKNVCTEACARERPAASLDERDETGRLHFEPSSHDRAFGDVELRDRLEKAIAMLSGEQRFLISAHYFAGHQYQDLAEILNMPMGTVKTHLHRAKERLREIMRSEVGTT